MWDKVLTKVEVSNAHFQWGSCVIDVECLVKWIIIIFIIYVIHLRFSIHSQTSVTTSKSKWCVSKCGTNQICEWTHGIIIWSQQNKDFRYVFAHDSWLTVYTFIENILKSLFATSYTIVNDSNSCLLNCDSLR